MNLKIEKELKVAVEINGQLFIGTEEGVLYQTIDDNDVFLYVKDKNQTKEIKIKISKEAISISSE